MGNINAVPVVSQVKSLVQVIQGDEEAARKTQEEFIRTAPVAAQINSLVHHINVSISMKIAFSTISHFTINLLGR